MRIPYVLKTQRMRISTYARKLHFQSKCDIEATHMCARAYAYTHTHQRGASLLRACGIARSVGFVIGLPGETDETVQMSIQLAHRVQPERLQFSRWTPLPGSPLVQAGRFERHCVCTCLTASGVPQRCCVHACVRMFGNCHNFADVQSFKDSQQPHHHHHAVTSSCRDIIMP